jgi:hypothetical protein
MGNCGVNNQGGKDGATAPLVSAVPTGEPLSPRSPRQSHTAAANFASIKARGEHPQGKIQDFVFSYLHWAPEPGTPCHKALHKCFAGALPSPAVHYAIRNVLEHDLGFKPSTSLFGTSVCPDEINNQPGGLVDSMKQFWGDIFPLGGISGAPFVGSSGFGAFSHHVPDDGDIVLLFGPHVGVSMDGDVGKSLRRGQNNLSTACGAVIGAYNACSKTGYVQDDETNFDDMQIGWIKDQLEPHVDEIKGQENPMVALSYQAYEMVKGKVERIVNLNFGKGRLVLVGGIQINMPAPFKDHFLPLSFNVRQKGETTKDLMRAFSCDYEIEAPTPKTQTVVGKVPTVVDIDHHKFEDEEDIEERRQHQLFHWLAWSPDPASACAKTLHKQFPGALPDPAVYNRVKMILTEDYGFTPSNTLFGTSICPDEINHTKQGLSVLMSDFWGAEFPMGGISGAPFGGKTGFVAFSHHVPDDGNIILMYGPHVGISDQGEVGKCLRQGQHALSTSCGAVVGAYNACRGMQEDEKVEFDSNDMQMSWVKSQILPHVARLQKEKCPLASLVYQAFQAIQGKINTIVNTNFGNGRLVLIGGIQINMPYPYKDHFLPLSFEVRQANQKPENILEAFHCPATLEDLELHHKHYHYRHDSVAGKILGENDKVLGA